MINSVLMNYFNTFGNQKALNYSLSLLLLLGSVFAKAQDLNCNNATLINTTGTYSGNTSSFAGNNGPASWLNNAVPGSSIENVGFYQFVAAQGATDLEFQVCIPSGCSLSGIQIYLFEQCGTNQGNVLSTLQLCPSCGSTTVSVGSSTKSGKKTWTLIGTNGFGNTYTVTYKLGSDDPLDGSGKCNWFHVSGLIPGKTYYWGVDGYSGANCNYTIQFLNGISVLPIKLTSLVGLAKANGNLLSWTTASESNNDYFEIESTVDGKNFRSVGKVAGAGNSNGERYYELLDKNPAALVTYYRLKQVDLNGVESFHNLISVKRSGSESTGVDFNPNPFNEKVTAELFVDVPGDYFFDFVDMSGKSTQQNFTLQKGFNQININTQPMAKGFYIVYVKNSTGEIISTQKMIKE